MRWLLFAGCAVAWSACLPEVIAAVPMLPLSHATDRDLDEVLHWSEPVDGIRCAVYVHATENESGDKLNRIALAIQNVSDHPVRWIDQAGDGNRLTLYLHRSAEILMGLSQPRSSTLDLVLEPKEIRVLDLFEGVERASAIQQDLCEGLFKFPSQSLSIQCELRSVPEGAWQGTIRTPISRGAIGVVGATPQSTQGRRLFESMMLDVRRDGTIPNGWLQLLGQTTRQFIQNNTGDTSGDAYARKMLPLVARFDRKTDWEQSEVVTLLDEIANVSTVPIDLSIEWIRERSFQRGAPLPQSYRELPWGTPMPSGLRMAWTFEPRSDAYPIHTSLRSVVLLHNAGNEPIAFVTRSFHQPTHVALGGLGELLATESIHWTTRGRPESYRLHPGEFCEVHAPGIRIGPRDADGKDWSNVRIGTYLLAQPGDRVAFEPGEILLEASMQEGLTRDWWPNTVRERLARMEPLPSDDRDREWMLFRAVDDLFGTSPRTDEYENFAADETPEALDRLAEVLAQRSWIQQATGSIQPGVVHFRVLEADPSAATRPRIASNPGRFALTENLVLVVSRRSDGVRILNEASLVRIQDRVESVSLRMPLPDGYESWVSGWKPGSTVLWVAERGKVRSYDFSDPAKIKSVVYDPASEEIPMAEDLREALKPAYEKPLPSDVHPMPQPASSSPAAASAAGKSADAVVSSKHDEVNALMQHWRKRARLNGDIPGGTVHGVSVDIDAFIEQYAEEEQASEMKRLRSKLDANRDWSEKELVALLDQIADLSTAPIAWTELKTNLREMHGITKEAPLPDAWKNAAWGVPAGNGLKAAWVLETQPKEVHVGDVLKSRVLFVNGGTKTVYLKTDTWRQNDAHEATDLEGLTIKIERIHFTGLTPTKTVCLRPGEFTEVAGHGIGIGALAFDEQIGQGQVGAIIHAKPGETIRFSTSMHFEGDVWHQGKEPSDQAVQFRRRIADRVALQLPIPPASESNGEERRHLLVQVTQELFGEPPTVEEMNAFLNDTSAKPEESLMDRLATRREPELFDGELKTGVQTLRVLPPVPNDATAVRFADRPGRYAVREGVHLQVTQITAEGSRTNRATVVIHATADALGEEHSISLPNGLEPYAILWRADSEELYVVEQGKARRLRIREGVQFAETVGVESLPEAIRNAIPEKLK